mmetsp:Transcript_35658/g.101876  ORF Transcript_35658/g.101876 Transcript_35658/m.101876 type:complete len:297 (+) Transcript_35658:77-967(+)
MRSCEGLSPQMFRALASAPAASSASVASGKSNRTATCSAVSRDSLIGWRRQVPPCISCSWCRTAAGSRLRMASLSSRFLRKPLTMHLTTSRSASTVNALRARSASKTMRNRAAPSSSRSPSARATKMESSSSEGTGQVPPQVLASRSAPRSTMPAEKSPSLRDSRAEINSLKHQPLDRYGFTLGVTSGSTSTGKVVYRAPMHGKARAKTSASAAVRGTRSPASVLPTCGRPMKSKKNSTSQPPLFTLRRQRPSLESMLPPPRAVSLHAAGKLVRMFSRIASRSTPAGCSGADTSQV